jgi:hypothetical protein
VDAALVTYFRLYCQQLYDQLPRWRTDLTGVYRMSFSTSGTIDWKKRIAEVVEQPETSTEIDELHSLLGTLFPRVAARSNF